MPKIRHQLLALAVLIGLCATTATTVYAANPPATQVYAQIVVDGPPPVAGEPVSYAADLRSGSTPLAGEPLQLQVEQAGASTFSTYGSTTTDSYGLGSIEARLTYDAEIRWHHPATANGAESFSDPISIGVATRVGATVSDRTLAIGQRLVVRGRTYPAKPGRIVRLYAGSYCNSGMPPPNCDQAVLLAKAYIAADGSYRLVRRFWHPGARQLFVRVPDTARNLAGFSSYRHVRVG